MNKTFVGQNILIHCYKHDGIVINMMEVFIVAGIKGLF